MRGYGLERRTSNVSVYCHECRSTNFNFYCLQYRTSIVSFYSLQRRASNVSFDDDDVKDMGTGDIIDIFDLRNPSLED